MRRHTILCLLLLPACSNDTFAAVDGDPPGDSAPVLDASSDAPDASTADASDPPDAADPPDASDASDSNTPTVRRVFISSTTYSANVGGLVGADALCQTLAVAASLGGTWAAWLSSTTTSASARLEHATVPYTLLDGTVIASAWSALASGTLKHAINLNEHQQAVPFNASTHAGEVWTGTAPDGTSAASVDQCTDWTSNAQGHLTYIGNDAAIDQNWTASGETGCSSYARALYCVEQKP